MHAQGKKNTVEGVWCLFPNPNSDIILDRNLSWGSKTIPRAFELLIDLHADTPMIEICEITTDEVIKVIESGKKTELTFHFARGNFDITMVCHFNNDGTMWIEPIEGITLFATGEKYLYYKIDGPEMSTYSGSVEK
jgi:hypothetical protein